VLAVQPLVLLSGLCEEGSKEVVASLSWPRDAPERKGGGRSVEHPCQVKDNQQRRLGAHHRNVKGAQDSWDLLACAWEGLPTRLQVNSARLIVPIRPAEEKL
jgi:hypothetical protein